MSLPAWARVTPERRAHIERVAALMGEWADAMETPPAERRRWLKAVYLHDALRDAPLVSAVAHGPAAAHRAEAEGETDRGVLDAARYHTVGYAGWDDVGRMLYLADYLEPGREYDVAARAAMARRVPRERDAVLREVAARRIEWVIRSGWALPRETVDFWNALVGQPNPEGLPDGRRRTVGR